MPAALARTGTPRWALFLAMAGVLVLAVAGMPAPEAVASRADGDCLACHKGIESMGRGHAFACDTCHAASDDAAIARPDHPPVIPNPSHPDHAQSRCGGCHAGEVAAVEGSVHATLAGIINQTRHLWGAQPATEHGYGLGAARRPLPRSSPRPRTTAMLVDDFLRARCLNCHIGTRGASVAGLYRAAGCAACHVPYGGDGRYQGRDATQVSRDSGRPLLHVMISPSEEACLRCHHGNHAGGDYVGLFERDTAPMFQAAASWGRPVLSRYGAAQHNLVKDVHAERGLECLDCHNGRQVMGIAPFTRPACERCHGDRHGNGPDEALPGLKMRGGRAMFRSRDGRVHPLPLTTRHTPGHDPVRHGRVACAACHAQWFFNDYGLSVLRRDAPPQDTAMAENTGWRTSDKKTAGAWTPGAWLGAYRFRRWEGLILGVDATGAIAPLRPRHQYLVSYVDTLGRTILDSVVPMRGESADPGWAFAPYSPHTTAPGGRACNGCHGNRAAAGLGPPWPTTPDMALLAASPPIQGQGRLLNAAEQQRLLAPSSRFREAFAAYLQGLVAAQEARP